MRALAAAGLLLLLLLAAPALAAPPQVFRAPFIPPDLLAEPPPDGTVSLVVRVWTGAGWMSDGLVIVPAEHVLPVECSTLPLKGAG